MHIYRAFSGRLYIVYPEIMPQVHGKIHARRLKMELYELYEIIGTAITILIEILITYCIIKLSTKIYYIIYDNNCKFNKITQENYKKNHFIKHFKKWLKSKELQKKYSDFYEYYNIQYNKQYMYSDAYNDFIKHKENKEQEKWQKK